MGRDFYCAVSGISHFEDADAIVNELQDLTALGDDRVQIVVKYLQDAGLRDSENGDLPVLHEPSPEAWEGLKVSEDDIEASKDLVLIAGYERSEYEDDDPDATPVLFCEADDEPECVENPTHAVALFNITPDPTPNEGGAYIRRTDDDDDEEGTVYTVWWQDCAYIVTFSAYCILQTVAPGLEPSVLYRVFTHRDDIECNPILGIPKSIDYGPISKSHDQYVVRAAVADAPDLEAWWSHLLTYANLSDEDLLKEAWGGKGNLWVFKRPDRFPVAAAASSNALSHFPLDSNGLTASKPSLDGLPVDILLLLCQDLPLKALLSVLSLNKIIRARLHPHANDIAYHAMRKIEPWYFPSEPIKTPDGTREREDLDWWENEWLTVADICVEDIRSRVKWLNYWIECSRDLHMRSRKRIWKTAECIKEVARKRGYVG